MRKATFLNNGQEESVRVLVTSALECRFSCALGTELSCYIIPIFIICIPIVLLGVCCYNLLHILRFTSTSLNIVFDPIEDRFASPLMFLPIQSSSHVDRIFLAELLACEFFLYYFDSLEILLFWRWWDQNKDWLHVLGRSYLAHPVILTANIRGLTWMIRNELGFLLLYRRFLQYLLWWWSLVLNPKMCVQS